MLIRNINGTSENSCKCGSWLSHWRNFSNQSLPFYCPVDRCTERTEIGAHVQKDDGKDREWYIVPLCRKHNAENGGVLSVNDHVRLVPANRKLTCEKE